MQRIALILGCGACLLMATSSWAEPPAGGGDKKEEDAAEPIPSGHEEAEQEATPPVETEPPPPPELRVLIPQLLESSASGMEDPAIQEALAEAGERREVVGLLVIALQTHRDEVVRATAARALGHLASEMDLHDIRPGLDDRDPNVVVDVAAAMHRIAQGDVRFDLTQLLGHQSLQVRCGAADVLRKIRGRESATALTNRLENATLSEEKSCLLAALVRAGHRDMLAPAVTLLGHSDTRDLGARVLLLQPRQALRVMGDALDLEAGEELVAASLAVAEQIGRDGFRWVSTLLAHRQESVRSAALEFLLAKLDEATVRPLLMRAAKRGEPGVRARVIEALAPHADETLVREARTWLGDEDPRVRGAAARVFVEKPSARDGELLLRSYQNERMQVSEDNVTVRARLIEAMGLIGNPDWVPVFVDACGQAGEERAAVDALVRQEEAAVRTLLLVVKVGDMQRIPYALEGLARIGHGVGEAAQGLFRHPRELIRELGRDLLAASGDPSAVGPLVALFQSETLEDPVPVIESIAMFSTPEAYAALVDAATHPSNAVRIAAVKGLGEMHRQDEGTVSTLVSVVETDNEAQVRAAAIESLFRIRAPGLVPLLIRVIQYDEAVVRTAAYEALGWAGTPESVPALAARLRTAEGEEAVALLEALRRLTRRDDLRSERNFREWYRQVRSQVAARAEGARTGEVEVGRTKLKYRSVGSGVPVVVISGHHGGSVFNHSLDLLAGSARVITYDGRGRGASALGTGLTLETELEDLEKLRIGLRVNRMVLVGHDVGGLVALAYARAHPRRVARIVLINTPPRGVRHGVVATAAQMLQGHWAQDLSKLDARHAWFSPVAWLGYRQFALGPALVANLQQAPLLASFPINPVAHQFLERAVSEVSLANLAPDIRAPIHVLVGERAPLNGSEKAELRRVGNEHRHVGVQGIRGTGHYPHLERADDFAALIRRIVFAER